MNLNLFMAIFWMVLGAGLVVYHWMFPGEQFLRLRWTDLSPGWLIMALAFWNVIRWWSAVAAEKDRKMQENLTYERQRRHHGSLHVERDEAPNPEFDFSSRTAAASPPAASSGEVATAPTMTQTPGSSPPERHWERAGGGIGFVVGAGVGIALGVADGEKEMSAIMGGAVFYAFAGAIALAIVGAVLGKLAPK